MIVFAQTVFFPIRHMDDILIDIKTSTDHSVQIQMPNGHGIFRGRVVGVVMELIITNFLLLHTVEIRKRILPFLF